MFFSEDSQSARAALNRNQAYPLSLAKYARTCADHGTGRAEFGLSGAYVFHCPSFLDFQAAV
jgi:hypothetical protein